MTCSRQAEGLGLAEACLLAFHWSLLVQAGVVLTQCSGFRSEGASLYRVKLRVQVEQAHVCCLHLSRSILVLEILWFIRLVKCLLLTKHSSCLVLG